MSRSPRRLVLPFVALVSLFSGLVPSHAQTAVRDVSRLPARSCPDWVRDAVVYEVFPRNFSPEGNFAGITARLDELKNLGVTVLWLMPIHPTGQKNKKGTIGSPYAVRDYDAINPDYGTADDLKHLVAEAHKRGMKVIIDIVANHTAWDCVLMESHPDFYTRDAQGTGASAQSRLVRRRRPQLRQPRPPRLHGRDAEAVADRLRP